jgi:hypothetical protein
MKLQQTLLSTILAATSFSVVTHAAIQVDISPGTGTPPGTLGGYSMVGFAPDPSPVGFLTSVTQLVPPAGALVSGNLTFGAPLAHLRIGGVEGWDTWSHGYAGDVYSTDESELMMFLPNATKAFYLYVEPNSKYTFEFKADSSATVATLDIDGSGGARYVGFYTDSPLTQSLEWIDVLQTTGESDGFAVGEFGIKGVVVPEPSTCLAGLLVCGMFCAQTWKNRNRQKQTSD